MWLHFAEDNSTSGPSAAAAEPTAYEVVQAANPTLLWLLPWAISATLHAGVILLTLFVVWAAKPDEPEEIIIPIAQWSDQPGGALTTQQPVDLTERTESRDVATQNVSDSQSLNLLNTELQSKLPLSGLTGASSGSELNRFVSSGSSAPKTNFYGAGGNAKRIVYIVDASGSLIDTFQFVIKELKRSISQLIEKQRFTVIFFQQDKAFEVLRKGHATKSSRPWRATSANKSRIIDWISEGEGNVVPQGSSNPIKALRRAFERKPDLIFLLSDDITGDRQYEIDRDVLLDMLDQLNPTRRTKINTIQFLYPDELDTLRSISQEHGGIHRFVSKDDLGIAE
ncbi:MAG: hypothetical protein CMJ49_04700 [Planctomycetaceae bacterium]|nr:hypothetical protein [Planctomycetaceae bacterium]